MDTEYTYIQYIFTKIKKKMIKQYKLLKKIKKKRRELTIRKQVDARFGNEPKYPLVCKI